MFLCSEYCVWPIRKPTQVNPQIKNLKRTKYPLTNTNQTSYFKSYFIGYSCTLVVYNLRAMNRIKVVLEEKGIKQTWLADKLGKSYNMVNSCVQNRQQPRLEVLSEIAVMLDVDIKDLIVYTKK